MCHRRLAKYLAFMVNSIAIHIHISHPGQSSTLEFRRSTVSLLGQGSSIQHTSLKDTQSLCMVDFSELPRRKGYVASFGTMLAAAAAA